MLAALYIMLIFLVGGSLCVGPRSFEVILMTETDLARTLQNSVFGQRVIVKKGADAFAVVLSGETAVLQTAQGEAACFLPDESVSPLVDAETNRAQVREIKQQIVEEIASNEGKCVPFSDSKRKLCLFDSFEVEGASHGDAADARIEFYDETKQVFSQWHSRTPCNGTHTWSTLVEFQCGDETVGVPPNTTKDENCLEHVVFSFPSLCGPIDAWMHQGWNDNVLPVLCHLL